MTDEIGTAVLAELCKVRSELLVIKSMLTPAIDSGLLTKSEAAKYLKVSGRTLQNLEASGKIRRAFSHGHPKYRRADLDTYATTGSSGVRYAVKRRRHD